MGEAEEELKTKHSKQGPNYTLFSEDGRALMYHPDTEALRRSCLYIDDETTPIKKGKPPREKRVVPVPDMPDQRQQGEDCP
jgi:hypothetical protein